MRNAASELTDRLHLLGLAKLYLCGLTSSGLFHELLRPNFHPLFELVLGLRQAMAGRRELAIQPPERAPQERQKREGKHRDNKEYKDEGLPEPGFERGHVARDQELAHFVTVHIVQRNGRIGKHLTTFRRSQLVERWVVAAQQRCDPIRLPRQRTRDHVVREPIPVRSPASPAIVTLPIGLNELVLP